MKGPPAKILKEGLVIGYVFGGAISLPTWLVLAHVYPPETWLMVGGYLVGGWVSWYCLGAVLALIYIKAAD